MAQARLLHKKISLSNQVNSLSLPAMLLFTWMIPHTDVEGKLKGDHKFVKATVVPMLNWPTNKVKKCIEEIADQGLIYYWQADNEWIIEFVNFKRYQTVREDHEKPSYLPSFSGKRDSPPTDRRLSDDSNKPAQSNITELNQTINKSEYKEDDRLADNNSHSFRKIGEVLQNTDSFNPTTEVEVAAEDAWKKLEPDNRKAFWTTYMDAAKKGLPASSFYQFTSEIKQDPSIKIPGAVFNKKVADYLHNRIAGG